MSVRREENNLIGVCSIQQLENAIFTCYLWSRMCAQTVESGSAPRCLRRRCRRQKSPSCVCSYPTQTMMMKSTNVLPASTDAKDFRVGGDVSVHSPDAAQLRSQRRFPREAPPLNRQQSISEGGDEGANRWTRSDRHRCL